MVYDLGCHRDARVSYVRRDCARNRGSCNTCSTNQVEFGRIEYSGRIHDFNRARRSRDGGIVCYRDYRRVALRKIDCLEHYGGFRYRGRCRVILRRRGGTIGYGDAAAARTEKYRAGDDRQNYHG